MKCLIIAIVALATPGFCRPQAPPPPPGPPAGAPPPPPRRPPPPPAQKPGGDVTPISIVSQTEVVGPDGSFNYSYDTSNGIHVEQGGYLKQDVQSRSGVDPNNPDADGGDGQIQVLQGAYSYTAPDGQQISLKYIADEKGFQPEGDHIPKVPEAIARSLEQQVQNPEQQQSQSQPLVSAAPTSSNPASTTAPAEASPTAAEAN